MKKLPLVLLVVLAAGCGPYIEDGSGGQLPGPICYLDSDCAPNDCCGEGTRVVHVNDAPSCRGVSCSGTCPANSIDCGCGIPVCRDQRCQIARTVSAECPAT